jgi:predicted phage-related endonuclease
MQTHDLVQGSAEWLEYRRNHKNASDAPAMMGVDKKTTRTELLRMMATGSEKEFSDWVQKNVLDNGHRFEALARPHAEEIIGEKLYPVTGSNGELSASFDGLTMMEDIGFEHKSLNDDLRNAMVEGCTGADLPMVYRVQLEQQLMVSEGEKTLFMASKWNGEELVEERHCWYESDADLRAAIIAGWKQFDEDLANYVHVEPAPAVVAAPVVELPAVSVQVSGSIAVIDNFEVFELALRDFIENRLIRKPETDQDFADLDTQIKSLKKAEAALEAAEAAMLSQVASIDAMKRTKDMLHKLARDNRLMAEKLLEAEKANRRVVIQDGGKKAYADHVEALNKRLGKPYMPAMPADFVGVTKGKKSITSIQDAVNTELARAKIAANEAADRIDMNLKTLRELATDFAFLFSDTAQLVTKSNDDLVNLIKLRISEHKAAEQAKLDAERDRIRAEEQAKAQAEAEAKVRAEMAVKAAQERAEAEAAAKAEADRQANIRAQMREQEIAEGMPQPAPAPVAEVLVEQPAPIDKAPSGSADLPAPKRPTDKQIIFAVATAFDVDFHTARSWIAGVAQEVAA